MMTPELINARKAYLSRLQAIRSREEQHLSEVDFQLFVRGFDPLIDKVRAEVEELGLSNVPQYQVCVSSIISSLDEASYSVGQLYPLQIIATGFVNIVVANVIEHPNVGRISPVFNPTNAVSAIYEPLTQIRTFLATSLRIRNDNNVLTLKSDVNATELQLTA